MSRYRLLTPEGQVESTEPGGYGGCRITGVFGTLACSAGKRMLKKNRVFFSNMKEALQCGYRPCNCCKPMDQADWQDYRWLVEEESLLALYHRKPRRMGNGC